MAILKSCLVIFRKSSGLNTEHNVSRQFHFKDINLIWQYMYNYITALLVQLNAHSNLLYVERSYNRRYPELIKLISTLSSPPRIHNTIIIVSCRTEIIASHKLSLNVKVCEYVFTELWVTCIMLT